MCVTVWHIIWVSSLCCTTNFIKYTFFPEPKNGLTDRDGLHELSRGLEMRVKQEEEPQLCHHSHHSSKTLTSPSITIRKGWFQNLEPSKEKSFTYIMWNEVFRLTYVSERVHAELFSIWFPWTYQWFQALVPTGSTHMPDLTYAMVNHGESMAYRQPALRTELKRW